MKDRLSDSEKEKIISESVEKGVSTHTLLEKLSHEISHEFHGEKNAWVYQESIKKLLQLKNKIDNKDQLHTLQQELDWLSQHLSQAQKKDFHDAIEWAKEVLKNSHDLIWEIKDEITDNNFTTDWSVVKKLFSPDTIYRGMNPQNFTDQCIWWWIGLCNSWQAVARISVKMLIWIGTSIPDTYKILTWKAETDAFKNV